MRCDFDTVIDRHNTYAMNRELDKLAPLAAAFKDVNESDFRR